MIPAVFVLLHYRNYYVRSAREIKRIEAVCESCFPSAQAKRITYLSIYQISSRAFIIFDHLTFL